MQSLVKTCLEMCAVDLTEVNSPAIFSGRSMQLGLSTGVAAEPETTSRRDKCSSEVPCPFYLKLHNRNDWSSMPLESEESNVITTRSRLMW